MYLSIQQILQYNIFAHTSQFSDCHILLYLVIRFSCPCLILSEEEKQPIGLWGQRHKQYLKEHKQFLYTTMLIEGTLNSYLADIDRQAQERLLLLTKQIAEQENVTEQLKADNAMLWVQKMNEIQSRVREIIYSEIIYA